MSLPEGATRPVAALGGRRVCRVGFGCYRVDDRVPLHRDALRTALLAGVNLVDTSTNYGNGHSELLVGKVLGELAAEGKLDREALVLVTKAGYVQGANQEEAIRRMRDGHPWPAMTEYSRDCWHCISPEFLRDQLTASLKRLRLPSVDALLLHNPEYFLEDAQHRGIPLEAARDAFYGRIRQALSWLEAEVAAGRAGAYGISSNTFVVPRERADAVDLTRVLELAGPGFKVIQLPMNPLELGAREPHHTADGQSVLDVARGAGLAVLVNRPLNAFGGRGLVRFAATEPPFAPLPSPPAAAWAALAEAEAEFARRFAPRLTLENASQSPGELVALTELFRNVVDSVPDLVAFTSVWEAYVAPRLEELLPQLAGLFAADPAFAAWAVGYRRAVLDVATLAVARPAAREAQRVAELDRRLVSAFGRVCGRTLSQRTVRALADTPGVDVVLLGMRRPPYVEDALGAFDPSPGRIESGHV